VFLEWGHGVMRAITKFFAVSLFLTAATASAHASCAGHPSPCVKDFAIAYPNKSTFPADKQGSTHEITFNRKGGKSLWITAPTYAYIAEVSMNGALKYFPMPAGTGPHGIVFNEDGELYVSLELGNAIVRVNQKTGQVEKHYPVNADPHGLGVAPDGKTLWFTGKTKNTVGKLLSDGTAVNYNIPTPGALPIYIAAGRDGNMWFTELQVSKIGRVSGDGVITEFKIPTDNSRPIAIVQDPSAKAMWFSEEAGNKVARIDDQGMITEFAVPKSQSNVILAGLAFDDQGNLWTQQYVDQNNPNPAGPDHIVRIGKSILTAKAGDKLDFTFYEVPTRQTVMHRIIQGPDKNMWFTELKSDRFGRVDMKAASKMK
jgi:virginiamycin B lyase